MSREVIEVLAPVEGGTYIDATVGLGGHAAMILEKIGHAGRIIGIDRDDEALGRTAERLNDRRVMLKKGSFSGMEPILNSLGVNNADGILFDLGVSMMQL
jgi:16S rRNA (cytosine1402-N4)-methyltransferase